MSHDEVLRGSDEPSRRPYGWLLIVAVALVAAVVSLLGHNGGKAAQVLPSPTPRPPATLKPLTQSTSPSPGPSENVGASASPGTEPTRTPSAGGALIDDEETCVASTIDSRLVVSLIIDNPTVLPETIVDVKADLPQGGLSTKSVTIRGGTCQLPAGKEISPVEHELKPGGEVMLIMRFAVPTVVCTRSIPLNAAFTVDIDGRRLDQEVPIYTSLDGVEALDCPSKSD